MYKNLTVYKTKEIAQKVAAEKGYTEDVTRFYSKESARCKCGETAIAVFENEQGKELTFAICQECGDEL